MKIIILFNIFELNFLTKISKKRGHYRQQNSNKPTAKYTQIFMALWFESGHELKVNHKLVNHVTLQEQREREKGGRWMKGKGESVILVCLNLSWNPWQQATISHQIIALGILKRSLTSLSPSYALFSLSSSDISVEKSKRGSFINSGLSPFCSFSIYVFFSFGRACLFKHKGNVNKSIQSKAL